MSFTLELPGDIGGRVGAPTVIANTTTYPRALRQLVAAYPSVRGLLVNSKDELRQTIRCSLDGNILNEETLIPDGSRIKLFFIRAGG